MYQLEELGFSVRKGQNSAGLQGQDNQDDKSAYFLCHLCGE